MPTTFFVIPLGVQTIIDPTEGNDTAEDADLLEGLVVGDAANPLFRDFQTFSPGSTGFSAGTSSSYDQDANEAVETFSIDGGPEQTFDGTAVYNATITYTDGTTATITAVIFQDTAGNTYLAPEFSPNSDQTALEAAPIQSIELNSLFRDRYAGMTGNREAFDYAVCFADGTKIRTPFGERRVETLRAGDLVDTLDNGAQPIRWIGGRSCRAKAELTPVVISPGALGKGMPRRRLRVSRHHRLLARSPVAARMFDATDTLIAAHHLVGLPGITLQDDGAPISYWHFLCDRHEIVFADGAAAETLYLGTETEKGLSPAARREIRTIFPDLVPHARPSARTIPSGRQQRKFVQRLARNKKPPFEACGPMIGATSRSAR